MAQQINWLRNALRALQRHGSQLGASALEYAGTFFVAAALIATFVTAAGPIGTAIGAKITTAVDSVGGGGGGNPPPAGN